MAIRNTFATYLSGNCHAGVAMQKHALRSCGRAGPAAKQDIAPILIARCPSRNCATQRFRPPKFASVFDVPWLAVRAKEKNRDGSRALTAVGDAPFAAQQGTCDAANHPGPHFSRLRTDSEQNLSLSCQWPSSEPGPARNQRRLAAASPCQCRRAGKCC